MNVENTAGEHQGTLIAEYRKKKNWTQEELAHALKVHPRTIQRLEEKAMIKDTSRRRFIAGLLGIPVALMGLEPVVELAKSVQNAHIDDRLNFYEEAMAIRWEVYFTGGTARAASGLDKWIEDITELAFALQMTSLHRRALTLLTMSYQLQNCIARDMLDFPQAHYAFRQARKVAEELGEEEFLASALAREGVTRIQEKKPNEAIKLFTGAINTIHYKGLPNLKGHILQALAEAHAMLGNHQESWRNLGLAERALESVGTVPEHSLARFNAASITAHRGIVAAQLREHNYAITLLTKSLLGYDPTMIRGRARLLAQKAEAFLGLNRIEECAATAEEAVTLARSVKSSRTIMLIESISDSLQESRWRKEPSIARLQAVLAM